MKVIARFDAKDSYAKEIFPWHLPLDLLTHVLYSSGTLDASGFAFSDPYADIQRYYIDHGDDWSDTDQTTVRGNVGQFLKFPNIQLILNVVSKPTDGVRSFDFYKYRIFGVFIDDDNPPPFLDALRQIQIFGKHGIPIVSSPLSGKPYILDLDVADCKLHAMDLSSFIDPYLDGFCFSNLTNCEECRTKLAQIKPVVVEPERSHAHTQTAIQSQFPPVTLLALTARDESDGRCECKCTCDLCGRCFYKEHETLPWSEGCYYRACVRVIYDGTIYESLMDHHARPLWTPDFAKSLWRPIP